MIKPIIEEEAKALNHYNNINYFDRSKFINASMSIKTLTDILGQLDILEKRKLNILDFGCGTGETSIYLSKNFDHSCFGIDYSQKRIDKANSYLSPSIDCKFEVGDVNEYVEKTEDKFDVILAFEIIEHLKNSDHIVKKLKNMLTEDGVLIITLPYQSVPNNIHLSAYKNLNDVKNRLGVEILGNFKMRFVNQNVFVYNNR